MATASSPFSTRGIVHAAAGLEKFSLSRFAPGPQLKPFVDHFWVVRYDLPAGTTHTQTVLSYPNVHLAFEHDEGRRALVYGIPRRPFVRELRGT
ncbi:MAG: AraC family transcriptional regulator, partial [Firmicutes bacterium]|nr:AraC family transcriptional regulator [Bacillota bacterium]